MAVSEYPVGALESLEQLVALMHKNKVLRLETPQYKLELSQEAFKSAEIGMPPAGTDEDLCACGHSLHVQHNQAGCVEGCAIALCEQVLERPHG